MKHAKARCNHGPAGSARMHGSEDSAASQERGYNIYETGSSPSLPHAFPSGMSRQKVFWGLLKRKERWGLSFRGWLLVGTVTIVTGVIGGRQVYPFLAVTRPVNTEILVVEGWIHEYAIRAGVEQFNSGHYRRVFSTGGPVAGNGSYVNDFQTSASVGADLLKANGIPDEMLRMVPSRVIGRDRTYSAAVALREWFDQQGVSVESMNVLTETTHARRSQLLFQKAFGDRVKVGVIAVRNPDYDPKHWWRYSEGVKDVISEGAAYLYAKCLFFPSASSLYRKAPNSSRVFSDHQ